MKEYACNRCGHLWIPRILGTPMICPKCKSPYWMVKKYGKITQELVRNLFDYHEDGYLIRRVKTTNVSKRGSILKAKDNTYKLIGIDNSQYALHVLIFIWHHGYFPELVDHKDRIVHHNWIDNLREISRSGNAINTKIRKNNISGICGVHWNTRTNRWMANIFVNSSNKYIGVYKEFSDAVMARYKKEIELGRDVYLKESQSYLYLKENNLL